MFECDVKLSSNDVPILLHDDTLDRTTNGKGLAGEQTWQTLAQLDAGSWHSPPYSGERLPSLDIIAEYCITNGFDLNIEIKPTAGTDEHTGKVVAQYAAFLWRNASRKPLLTSFKPAALRTAQHTAPSLQRGLLLHELWAGWLEAAHVLECTAIVCNHKIWNSVSAAKAKNARFKTMSYTVNDKADVQRLTALGIDGIITDRVDIFKPE